MYYKANVYKIENKIRENRLISANVDNCKHRPEVLDEVIVDVRSEDGILTAKEILTGFSIDVFKDDSLDSKGLLNDDYCNYRRLREYDVQLFTLENQFCLENKATGDEVEAYFERFPDSEFKNFYVKTQEKVKTNTR